SPPPRTANPRCASLLQENRWHCQQIDVRRRSVVPKLNQIIAIAAGKKTQAHKAITEAHQVLQKTALLDGISRTSKPRDDEGEQLPPEKKNVQLRVHDAVRGVTAALTELFDVVATQDHANTVARANVVVDGVPLLKGVPVTTLLFLEKQVVDLH